MSDLPEIDSNLLERIIIKNVLRDKNFAITLSSVFDPEYFDNPTASVIYDYTTKYIEEYKSIPDAITIINSTKNEVREDVKSLLNDINSIDFDIDRNYKFLFKQTNEYLKEQAMKKAIMDSVDIIDKKHDKNFIRQKIEAALSKDLCIDLGLRYFENLGDRLRRIFSTSTVRVPTYLPELDEFISGGFPPFTLSVIIAKIHQGKSNFLANVAARQVLHGKNVVLMTLEMSEDAFAQRFDSIYSLLDINRMYISSAYRKKLVSKLKEVASNENRGELFIKQFPTGEASVNDFRKYLRELTIRDIKPDILMADYINLMKASTRGGDGLYSNIKRIAEELRALSFEFEVPVLSVSQLNREGSFVSFEELDFNYVAESWGLPAASDFISIFGTDEDAMVYENEIHCKVSKNRLGGRVGEMFKLYLDAKSLKLYSESELDQWISDANESGDERELHQRRERQERQGNRRR